MEFWRMPWPKAVALASLAAEQGSRNFAYAKFRAPHPPSPSSTRRASPWPKAVAYVLVERGAAAEGRGTYPRRPPGLGAAPGPPTLHM